ncbi:MAG: M81 family metallopeptidase [Planctomycetales bacterium]
MNRKRVLLAGIFHETHTFLGGVTSWRDFQCRRGKELFAAEGDGSPLAGVLETARDCQWEVAPVVDLRATPSATATDQVVERFWSEFQAATEQALSARLDGIFLVLHGAMVSESFPDVEGELLTRIRATPGLKNLPLCGVLDLHANVSQRTAELSHGLIAYRENPHTDAHATAVRAARLLDRLMKSGERPVTAWNHPPVIWPPTGTGTADDPMKTLESMAREIESRHEEILAVNVHAGFCFSDAPDVGVSFTAITLGDPNHASARLQELADWTVEHRETGTRLDIPLADVVPLLQPGSSGPILLVEPSDNIGGGAPGDGTSVLQAFIDHDLRNSAVILNDPEAVAELAAINMGDRATLPLGGKSGSMTEGPLELEVELLSTSDGVFELEDRHSHLASMQGTRIEMGACAVVRHQGIRILLTSRKTPPFDLGQWRSQGIQPETLFVIGVKAAVAHRRACDPIASASYTVSTPGPCSSDLRTFPYQHARRPIYPLDPI